MTKDQAQALVKLLLGEYLGEDAEREGLLRTPERVIKSWGHLYGGYDQDPAEILSTTFDSGGLDQMVVLRDIEFYSMCEHHMLPFFGRAHVAYIPNGRVVGVSKIARLVDCYARRLQIQERLAQQIATGLMDALHPQGVAVVIKARHLCMVARGVEKQNSEMVTSVMLGLFREDVKARAEAVRLFGEAV